MDDDGKDQGSSVAHSSGMVEVNPGRSSAVCLRT
jgi:hypothetical protein